MTKEVKYECPICMAVVHDIKWHAKQKHNGVPMSPKPITRKVKE